MECLCGLLLSDFVHFVNKYERVFGAGLFKALYHFAGHCTDICATMSFDLRYISHTTDGEAEIFTI